MHNMQLAKRAAASFVRKWSTCANACTRTQAERGAAVLGAVDLNAVRAWVGEAVRAPFMTADTIVTDLSRSVGQCAEQRIKCRR